MKDLSTEQARFVAVLTALYPEGIPVEKYSTIIDVAEFTERCLSEQRIESKEDEIFCTIDGGLNTKRCEECGLILPLDHFYKQAKAPDGLRSTCKKCKPHRGWHSKPKIKPKADATKIRKIRAKALGK